MKPSTVPLKTEIISSTAAPAGWHAVYLQQGPRGALLVPMPVALFVLVEQPLEPQADEPDAARVLVRNYRPYVLGRNGTVVDVRAVESDTVTYLIMAAPDENWQAVGRLALDQLRSAMDAQEPTPEHDEAPLEANPETPTAAPSN